MRAIDADELKTAFPCGEYVRTESVRATIDNMPTIEPRRTGKWIDGRCNQCGNHAPFWSMATTYYESNFCPNCGSYNGTKMSRLDWTTTEEMSGWIKEENK